MFNESLLIDNKLEIELKNKNNKKLEINELTKTFLIGLDNFIVNRANFGLHTVIAGYYWFLDWGRDTLISFEGLVLIPKRFEIAKQILLTITRDIKNGLVPNRIF